MINMVAETALKIALITTRIFATLTLIGMWLIISITAVSLIGGISENSNIINETIGMIQIWTPFNLAEVIIFLLVITQTIITYKVFKYITNSIVNQLN